MRVDRHMNQTSCHSAVFRAGSGRASRDVVHSEVRLSPLKILHILDSSIPVHSGYAFRSQNVLKEQQRRGWSPVALTSPKHQAAWKGSSREREEIEGLCYYRTEASDNSIPFGRELQLMRLLAKRIEFVARSEKPDLLHAHSPVLNALPTLWIGHKLGLPVAYEIRAFWEDAAVDHGTYSERSVKYRVVRLLETWACRHASQIAVICGGLRDELILRGIPAQKITVVSNGTDPVNFRAGIRDSALARDLGIAGKKVIGFVGSFNHYEGLDLLIRAVEELATMRSDIVALLVGGGEMENELRDQINQKSAQGRVILPGRIPHERIPEIYSLMDLLVYPRYSIRLTELVTPLKPLEAMAMGKPIVASDVGGHRELIRDGETGVLFQAGDLTSLVKTLNLVLDNDEWRERIAAQGADWVRKNRSWEKTTSSYSEIYERALNKRLSGIDTK